jgi:hypothetical protein
MEKFENNILSALLLILLASCEYDNKTTNKPIVDMMCLETDNYGLTRCENHEVICYILFQNSLQCNFKNKW